MDNSMKLLQVQVFFRHGARTPLFHVKSSIFPEAIWSPELSTDLPHTLFPYRLIDISTQKQTQLSFDYLDKLFVLPGGNKVGELTKTGQQDAYNLGIRLKKQYKDNYNFISYQFQPSQFHLRTTFIARTIKSLRCVMAGLYGDNISLTEPVNFQCDQLNNEILFPNPHTCQLLTQLFNDGIIECNESKTFQEMKQKLKNILGVDKLLDCVEQRSTDYDCPIYFVRDDYLARKYAGFPIPAELEKLLPEMHKLCSEELLHEFLGKQKDWEKNVHIVLSDLFSLILENMINYQKVPQFHLYSCHDSSIMLLLFGLNVFDGCWPPFAADIIFELYTTASTSSPSLPSSSSTNLSIMKSNKLHSDNISLTNDNLNDLWFRLIYLGKPLSLKTLWDLSYSNHNHYLDHHQLSDYTMIPFKVLYEYINKAKKIIMNLN
ncbi:Lysophosphatidic acid phosphatase type 6 [Schistosoma haematobium]|uniref:2-phosphoxylose phosphatase 1 n=2 Tax=Schistosoma haematobium TaxID=6185 RepID=A0A922ISU2_SCHHA|nr:Lysophosphatidic acid phosphatase type 6 [Schistosoma haematobium]KAH9586017.1 Lysophosphatidic acid phosphatase type 6 [Schistosoma haematobium]